MKNKPLFLQLFFNYMPVILVGVFSLILLINQATRTFYYNQTENELKERAKLLSQWIIEKPFNDQQLKKFCKKISQLSNMRVTVIDKEGVVLGDSHKNIASMDNHRKRPEIREAIKLGESTSQRFSKTLNKKLMYYSIYIKNHTPSVIVRISQPLGQLDLTISNLQRKIIYLGIVIGFFLLLISYFISKKITNPIDFMRKETEKYVNTMDGLKPLPIPQTKELASLSISLNKMAKEMDNRIKIIEKEKNDRESLLSSMQDGIIAIDKRFNILSINSIAIEYLKLPDKNYLNKKITNIIKQKKIVSLLKKVLKHNNRKQQEIAIKHNKKRFFLINAQPLFNNNIITGALLVINDITFQKQLEKVRQDFVSNVSHELKTPITSILGYIEILQKEGPNSEHHEQFLSKVLNHTNRMNAIIDDLLRLSKIESQEEDSTIMLVPHELFPVLEGAVEDLDNKIKENRNKIKIICQESIMVNGDPQLLREAITNLVENAIKYGLPLSEIQISVTQTDMLYIHIDNEGDEIQHKDRKRIFERFYRIDKSRDREAGGTGLGLAIVKHIAFAHNGDVDVKRTSNGKTRFTISLPKMENEL